MEWDSQFTMTTTDTERMLVGNGLPNHPTGVYPIEKGTAAYEYYSALPAMGYDNSAEIPIEAYEINLTLPAIRSQTQIRPACTGSSRAWSPRPEARGMPRSRPTAH